MFKIYIAIDCSSSIVLNYADQNAPNPDKFRRALTFAGFFVEELLSGGGADNFAIDLISLSSEPKIVKRAAKTRQDVLDNFPLGIITSGKHDFLALRDLILEQNPLTNFELIVLLDATHRQWIPPTFRLPCAIHFVAVADHPDTASGYFLVHLRSISQSKNSFVEYSTPNPAVPNPLLLCRTENEDQTLLATAKQLANIPRLHGTATIHLSSAQSIQVQLIPQIQRTPLCSYDGEQITKVIPDRSHQNTPPSFKLLGFTKCETLINIPSSSCCHIMKPEAPKNSEGWSLFHLMAEVLGAEGQCAVVQEEHSEEEYVLRPYRDDPTKLWMLCLQLVPSATIRWKPASAAAAKPAKVQFPEVSYKQGASTRIYWTDAYGLQSDIQRLQRLLKRPDRVEQFRTEMHRVALYATALGYHSFSTQFADILERKSANIPAENRPMLQRTTQMLREGGFKQVMQQMMKS